MKVVGGGTIGDTQPIAYSGPAKPGEPDPALPATTQCPTGVQYPCYPHYTYIPPEEGWVVHNGNVGQTMQVYADCVTPIPDAIGRLSKIEDDLLDLWTIDLKVPPVEGYVGQDWPAGCPTVPTNDIDYGCDLWIEVTGISETPK